LSGNEKERTVTVVDPEDPIISPKPEDQIIKCEDYSVYEMPELHCEDNCGATTMTRTVSTHPGTCDTEYTLEVYWLCTDSHGRTDDWTFILEITDNTEPDFNIYALEVTAPCDDVPVAPYPGGTDNCDEVTVDFHEDQDYFEFALVPTTYSK
jgi:phage pi2 protein 07